MEAAQPPKDRVGIVTMELAHIAVPMMRVVLRAPHQPAQVWENPVAHGLTVVEALLIVVPVLAPLPVIMEAAQPPKDRVGIVTMELAHIAVPMMRVVSLLFAKSAYPPCLLKQIISPI